MEPILTEKELEDIFAVAAESASGSDEIKEISLAARRRFESRAAGAWHEASKTMRPALVSLIAGAVGERVEVDVLDIVSLDGSGMGNDSFEAGDAEGWTYRVYALGSDRIIAGVSRGLARSYVARRTGTGTREGDHPRSDAAFTPLERRMLGPLFEAVVKAVTMAVPEQRRIAPVEKDPAEVLRSRGRKQAWLEMTIHCQNRDDLGIWFAADALLFSSKQACLGSGMANSMTQTAVGVSAELGRFRMTVGEFQALSLGTIVRLDTMLGDHFPIYIEGVPKMLGEPLVSRGNVAVRISGRIENGEV